MSESDVQMLGREELAARGWSSRMRKTLLPEPDARQEMGPGLFPRPLYGFSTIEALERDPEVARQIAETLAQRRRNTAVELPAAVQGKRRAPARNAAQWLDIYQRGDLLDRDMREELKVWLRTMACQYVAAKEERRRVAEQAFREAGLVYHLVRKQDISLSGNNGEVWAWGSAENKERGSFEHLVASLNAYALARIKHHEEGEHHLKRVLVTQDLLKESVLLHVVESHHAGSCPCGRVEQGSREIPQAGVLADGDGEADIHPAADRDHGVGI